MYLAVDLFLNTPPGDSFIKSVGAGCRSIHSPRALEHKRARGRHRRIYTCSAIVSISPSVYLHSTTIKKTHTHTFSGLVDAARNSSADNFAFVLVLIIIFFLSYFVSCDGPMWWQCGTVWFSLFLRQDFRFFFFCWLFLGGSKPGTCDMEMDSRFFFLLVVFYTVYTSK